MVSVLLITIGSKRIMQIGPYSSIVRTKERWSTGHFLLFITSNLRNKSIVSYLSCHVMHCLSADATICQY
jgi:hypothetical protein